MERQQGCTITLSEMDDLAKPRDAEVSSSYPRTPPALRVSFLFRGRCSERLGKLALRFRGSATNCYVDGRVGWNGVTEEITVVQTRLSGLRMQA